MLLYVVAALTGIISGMGVGGGILLIPILVFVFQRDQHLAQGVTLLAYLPTSLVAAITHYYNKHCNLRVAGQLAVGGIAGSLIGAALAAALPSVWLRRLFAIFLAVMAIYQLKPPGKSKSDSDPQSTD
jgi:uncharacterized protein